MQQPIRILHVIRKMNRGGAETLIMNAYRHIDRDRFQFDYAVHEEEAGHYDEEIKELGGRIFVLPAPLRSGLRGYLGALRRTLKDSGPFEVVHSHVHHSSGFILPAAKRCGVPIRISHSHTTEDGYSGSLKRYVYRFAMEQAIRKYATHFLGCSEQACHALFGRSSLARDNVEVLPNGIDLTRFLNEEGGKQAMRMRLGLPAEGLLVGQVHRFDPEKNHRFTVDWFESLRRLNERAHLVLVGDGELRPEVERALERKGLSPYATFLGIRSDVPDILKALDLLIMPSVYEGLGIILIEAQAAGIPVLCSDAIPVEADLKLGIVERLTLDLGAEHWAEAALRLIEAEVPDADTRRTALVSRKYDIRYAVGRLMTLYSHATPQY
jgi:glycosyltransferase EpsF